MRFVWARPAAAALLLVCAAAAPAQDQLLGNKDAFELYGRAVQLMESVSLATPELARAGAPIAENARSAVATLRSMGRQHAGVTYSFLGNARAFLVLSDAVPKPDGFPAEAAKQLTELRAVVDRADVNFRALLTRKESDILSTDRDNLARYAEANTKLAAPVPGHPRVVFLGDSITDGWRLNEYFSGRDFVNRGISGQTTGEMLGRMQADVIDLKPEAVLILAGTNDIARGIPLRTIENNLAMIASLAEQHGIKPLIASVLPISDYHKDQDPSYEKSRKRPPQTILALNDWIRAQCAHRGYIHVDYFTPTVDSKGFLRAELADDGLHPNSAGYRAIAPVALAAIDRATAGSGKGKRRR
jgi:lysophospholipase L1-like esterase